MVNSPGTAWRCRIISDHCIMPPIAASGGSSHQAIKPFARGAFHLALSVLRPRTPSSTSGSSRTNTWRWRARNRIGVSRPNTGQKGCTIPKWCPSAVRSRDQKEEVRSKGAAEQSTSVIQAGTGQRYETSTMGRSKAQWTRIQSVCRYAAYIRQTTKHHRRNSFDSSHLHQEFDWRARSDSNARPSDS